MTREFLLVLANPTVRFSAALHTVLEPHFMYRCRLAGDTVIKYLEVVLGRLLRS